MILDLESLRVLGGLMEKEMTTPETYPLSLNGLMAAANQKTSRDPVLNLSEEEVRNALGVLEEHMLISTSRDARVPKYEHRIRTVLNLRRDETALLCVLLLRGPQTAGELRGRAERMLAFEDIASVQAALERMAGRETPLVRALPRLPGSREGRWMHLLGSSLGEEQQELATAVASGSTVAPEPEDDLVQLRSKVAELEIRLAILERSAHFSGE